MKFEVGNYIYLSKDFISSSLNATMGVYLIEAVGLYEIGTGVKVATDTWGGLTVTVLNIDTGYVVTFASGSMIATFCRPHNRYHNLEELLG